MDIVAIVGHQHRLLARQNDDIADVILLHLELVHVQRVIQQLIRRLSRHGNVIGIRHVAHQLQIAFQLFKQLLAGQRALARSQ
ncbi:hypothetical protein D3C87_1792520 [compost metagenome]